MSARTMGRGLLLAVAAFGAGCNPEQECRSGLDRMRPRVEGAIGTGAHPEAQEQISQAYAAVDQAEKSLKAGSFADCLDQLDAAGVLLNKSQRTNQQ